MQPNSVRPLTCGEVMQRWVEQTTQLNQARQLQVLCVKACPVHTDTYWPTRGLDAMHCIRCRGCYVEKVDDLYCQRCQPTLPKPS
jgi:hypothetical protein